MTYCGVVCRTAVLIAIVGLAGCSSRPVYRAASQLCIAQGGTYSHATQQCTFTAGAVVPAQKACEDLGGIYTQDVQRCEFND